MMWVRQAQLHACALLLHNSIKKFHLFFPTQTYGDLSNRPTEAAQQQPLLVFKRTGSLLMGSLLFLYLSMNRTEATLPVASPSARLVILLVGLVRLCLP